MRAFYQRIWQYNDASSVIRVGRSCFGWKTTHEDFSQDTTMMAGNLSGSASGLNNQREIADFGIPGISSRLGIQVDFKLGSKVCLSSQLSGLSGS